MKNEKPAVVLVFELKVSSVPVFILDLLLDEQNFRTTSFFVIPEFFPLQNGRLVSSVPFLLFLSLSAQM